MPDNTRWNRWDGHVSRAAAVDPISHSIYVVGETFKPFDGQPYLNGHDGFLVKYSANGTRLWSRIYGSQMDELARQVKFDLATGDVILCGSTYGSFGGRMNTDPTGNTFDVFLSRYTEGGEVVWSTIFGSTATDRCEDFEIDQGAGFIYLAGETVGSIDGQVNRGGQDTFLAKIRISDGVRQWTRMVGSSSRDTADGIAILPAASTGVLGRRIFLIGGCSASIGGQSTIGGVDVFVSLFSVDGAQQWTRLIGTRGDDSASGAHWAERTDVLHISGGTTGSFPGYSNMGGQDAFLIQLTANGTLRWILQWGTQAEDSVSDCVYLADAQTIYVAGNTAGVLDGLANYGTNDIFLSQISLAGAYIQSESWGTPNYDFAQYMGYDVVLNYIYLTGQYGSFSVLGQYKTGLPFNYSATPTVPRIKPTISTSGIVVAYEQSMPAMVAAASLIGFSLILALFYLFRIVRAIAHIPKQIQNRRLNMKLRLERQVANEVTRTNTVGMMETAIPQSMVFALPGAILIDPAKDLRVAKRTGNFELAEPFENGLKQRSKGRMVAIHYIEAPGSIVNSEEMRAAFRREVSIMYAFSEKPFFSKIYGFSEHPPVLVTKYYPQGDLQTFVMQPANSVTKRKVIFFARNICAALAEMHQADVLHGSLCSRNILVDETIEGRVFCVLTGFGKSRLLHSDNTLLNRMYPRELSVYKAHASSYKAPEQLKMGKTQEKLLNINLAFKMDIYSIGLILQELMNRYPPWN